MNYIDMHCDTLAEALARKSGTAEFLEGTKTEVEEYSKAAFCKARQRINPSAFEELFRTTVTDFYSTPGFKKGIKQLGKSAIKVVGDTAGFIGGECVGTAIGAAAGSALAGTKIGAAIGSVFPGFGTAIGAAVGCVCGMLGSFVMGKVTKAITGKSEREKAAEQQENQQLNELIKNKQSIEELKAEALLKLQEEAAQNGGELKGDALVAYAALQNLDKTNPYLTV